MTDGDGLVESLPDRPLTQPERFAFASHDAFETIIPDDVREDPDTGEEAIHAALFVAAEWVTAVRYDEESGWSILYRSEKPDDDVTSGGVLSSADLDADHPIRAGMAAMRDAHDGDQ